MPRTPATWLIVGLVQRSVLLLLTMSGVDASAQTFANGVALGDVNASQINEASGLAASRQNPGVLWTHNDTGTPGNVYALSTNGTLLAIYHVPNAPFGDYEDIAIGPGPSPNHQYIYLGNIGDNFTSRASISVYRFPEPAIYHYQSNDPPIVEITGVEELVFTYPDGPHNCEGMMVDPITGDLYLATKLDDRSGIYRARRADLISGSPVELTFVREITFFKVSAADISPDGSLILLRRGGRVDYWTRAAGQSVGAALAGASVQAKVATEPNGEAVAFHPTGLGYYTTSEQLNQPIYYFRRTDTGVPAQPAVFIRPGETWRYNDTGADLGTNWVSTNYTDGAWTSGTGQFGYGQGDEQTTISFGGDDLLKNTTTYFRKKFNVAFTNGLNTLALRVCCNDGLAIYLNGAEILRRNLNPFAPYNALALADTTGWENIWQSFPINPRLLRNGTNTLAVEGHRFDPAGATLSFDLQLLAGRVDQPLRFITPPQRTNLVVNLNLAGPVGFEAVVESGTDFTQWLPVATAPLTNGTARVVDGAPISSHRFYRLR